MAEMKWKRRLVYLFDGPEINKITYRLVEPTRDHLRQKIEDELFSGFDTSTKGDLAIIVNSNDKENYYIIRDFIESYIRYRHPFLHITTKTYLNEQPMDCVASLEIICTLPAFDYDLELPIGRGYSNKQFINDLYNEKSDKFKGGYHVYPEKVIFNKPATIVIWNDGRKTVVKCQKGDRYDPEKGLAMAYVKRLCGLKEFYKSMELGGK